MAVSSKELLLSLKCKLEATQTGSTKFASQSEARTISERTTSDGVSRHIGLYFDLEKLNFSNLPSPGISLNLANSTEPTASPLFENHRQLCQLFHFAGLEPEMFVFLTLL